MFKPMLAATLNPDEIAKLRFPLVASPKYDGIRSIIGLNGPLTRTLKRIPNEYVHSIVRDATFADGELIVGDATNEDCFNHTTRHVMSRTKENFPFKFFMFDWLEQAEKPWWHRHENLQKKMFTLPPAFFHVVDQEWCTSVDQVLQYEEKMLNLGFEGVMLRDPNAPYKFGRSTFREQGLLKLKRFEDDEATITGFTELFENNNTAKIDALGHTTRSTHQANLSPMGTLGSIQVQCENFPETFSIGTGFNVAQRAEMWKQGVELLGKTVKFKYQKVGVVDSPRFPVFLGFRED